MSVHPQKPRRRKDELPVLELQVLADTDTSANAWLMAAIGLATMIYAIALNSAGVFQ